VVGCDARFVFFDCSEFLYIKNKTIPTITIIEIIINNIFSIHKKPAGQIEPPFFGILSFL
jgi:hypothetical protein